MNGNGPLFETFVKVKDLKSGEPVLQFLELRSKEARKTRSGQDYLDLVVGDAGGSITAKMWSDAIRKWGQDFQPGDVVKIEGRVEAYKDRNQIVVEKIRRADPSEVPDLSSLIRMSSADPDALFSEMLETAAGLAPEELAALVERILTEHVESFKTAPAAKMIHHAYKGGLIEHTSSVMRKVQAILPLEPAINRGLAIAGAILHDIGKTKELAASGSVRTVEGRLIGHVILGVRILEDAAHALEVSDRVWFQELEHIVLSHHGETQFGAPVRPLTREALLVHFVDNLDSKLKIIDEALEEVDSEGFSSYNKWLEGRAFVGSAAQEQEE